MKYAHGLVYNGKKGTIRRKYIIKIYHIISYIKIDVTSVKK